MTRFVAATVLLSTILAAPATAQDRPAPVAEFAAGALLFADDGIVTEGFGGGAVRFHLTPRLSVGPELSFVAGDGHSHFIVTGNATFDFIRPDNGALQPVTPFVVVGAGLFQTREHFQTGTFTSGEGAFTVGGGIRGRLSSRVVAGADVRIGWETHIRLNGLIGVRLGN